MKLASPCCSHWLRQLFALYCVHRDAKILCNDNKMIDKKRRYSTAQLSHLSAQPKRRQCFASILHWHEAKSHFIGLKYLSLSQHSAGQWMEHSWKWVGKGSCKEVLQIEHFHNLRHKATSGRRTPAGLVGSLTLSTTDGLGAGSEWGIEAHRRGRTGHLMK